MNVIFALQARVLRPEPGLRKVPGMDATIRQIVSQRHPGEGSLAVLRHVIAQFGDGYATFAAGMSRARRRELIRQVFACHRENRARYQQAGSRSASFSSPGSPRENFAAFSA